jgi:two-component system chemotaxis response regulator CheY
MRIIKRTSAKDNVKDDLKFTISKKNVDLIQRISVMNTIENVKLDKTCKHLVVDDVKTNRDIMKIFLSKRGLEIDEAKDGLEALQKCSLSNYDVIWSDLNMDHMSGLELVKELRNRGFKKYFVLITGSYPEEKIARQLQQVDLLYIKPIKREKLYDLDIMKLYS